MSRDEFKHGMKKIVAERSAYMCNNPDCRKMTIGPHSDSDKSLSDGVTAHICAAAKGGPRYDPNQTKQERESVDNAIWLCHNCSDIVDKDEKKYTEELLLEWKRRHEEFIRNKEMEAAIPDVQLHTQHGFTLPTSMPVKITGEHCEFYREHTLIITNQNEKPLHYIHLQIQFPESIIDYPIIKKPPGVNIVCKPNWMEVSAVASGKGSVEVTKSPKACENYVMEIDRIPPNKSIEVRLFSIKKKYDEILRKIDEEIAKKFDKCEEYLHFFIIGSYQYEWRDIYYEREFLVPLHFDCEQRLVSSLPCEENIVNRNLCIHEVW